MTKNKRYEAHFDALNDARILQATAQLAPCTLPQQAYGPEPLSLGTRSTARSVGLDYMAGCAGNEDARRR